MAKSVSETPKVDLVGVGLNCTDTLIPLAEYPVRGSKVEHAEEIILPGGQTATAIVACQTWGLATRYVGKLGDDDAARLHRSEFSRLGVDARIVTVPGAASPHHWILIENGERTVLGPRNERLLLTPEDLEQSWIENARALLVDGFETAAAIRAARWARAASIPVIADLDESYPGVEELMGLVDHLVVSRDFPIRFTGEPDLKDALRLMHLRFGCSVTAATLGEGGVLAWDGARFHSCPAYRVPVVDSTGTGDVFHAAYIYGLLQGFSIARQLGFACAAAALNCAGLGARGGIQSVEAVEQLMATADRYEPIYADSAL